MCRPHQNGWQPVLGRVADVILERAAPNNSAYTLFLKSLHQLQVLLPACSTHVFWWYYPYTQGVAKLPLSLLLGHVALIAWCLKCAGEALRGSNLQDILRLLTLWFTHGAAPDVEKALEEGFTHVSIDTWLVVIPQARTAAAGLLKFGIKIAIPVRLTRS